MDLTPDQIMREYRDAYERVVCKSVQIGYERGWYTIYNGGMISAKKRGTEVQAMTRRILSRLTQTEEYV